MGGAIAGAAAGGVVGGIAGPLIARAVDPGIRGKSATDRRIRDAIPTQVEGLKRAGLNPALMYPGGSSAASVASATGTALGHAPGVDIAGSARDAASALSVALKRKAELKLIDAQGTKTANEAILLKHGIPKQALEGRIYKKLGEGADVGIEVLDKLSEALAPLSIGTTISEKFKNLFGGTPTSAAPTPQAPKIYPAGQPTQQNRRPKK